MKFTSFLALGGLLCTVSARPSLDAAARAVNRIIPGPGLPSLKQLGITEEELDTKYRFQSRPTIYAQGKGPQPYCTGGDKCSTKGVNKCLSYLAYANSTCSVDSSTNSGLEIETCEYGDAKIFIGVNRGGNASTECSTISAFAQDVKAACKAKGKVYGFMYIPKQNYTAKGFIKDNSSFFVEIMAYNSTSPSPTGH